MAVPHVPVLGGRRARPDGAAGAGPVRGPVERVMANLRGSASRNTVLVMLGAVVVGALAAVAPVLALAAVGLIVVTWLYSMGRLVTSLMLGLLALLLIGYAIFNKGLAHAGAPPLYVSEMVLAVALLSLGISFTRLRLGLVECILVAFMAWGAFRTLPYLGTWGIDALRDAVVWAYGIFAFAVAAVLQRRHFERFMAIYERLIPYFLLLVPVLAVLHYTMADRLPAFPGSEIGFIFFKAGDAGVHLAGIAAFLLLGMGTQSTFVGIREGVLWGLWFVDVGLSGAINRGGFISASAGTLAALVAPSARRWLPGIFAALLMLATLGIVNPEVDVGLERKLSIDQLAANVISVLTDQSSGDLQGTKEWRLRWWDEIVTYTVHGPYFWAGKGFGINLADDDGFQVNADGSLRAPHSAHLGILARMGVPGLVLWIALQAAFGLAMLRAVLRTRRSGDTFWMNILVWLSIYWIAGLVNSSFDVYLEGPQGGILFWTVIGAGLAAIGLSRQDGKDREAPDGTDRTPGVGAPRRGGALPSSAV